MPEKLENVIFVFSAKPEVSKMKSRHWRFREIRIQSQKRFFQVYGNILKLIFHIKVIFSFRKFLRFRFKTCCDELIRTFFLKLGPESREMSKTRLKKLRNNEMEVAKAWKYRNWDATVCSVSHSLKISKTSVSKTITSGLRVPLPYLGFDIFRFGNTLE